MLFTVTALAGTANFEIQVSYFSTALNVDVYEGLCV